MPEPTLDAKLDDLPDRPGVYQFLDHGGKLLYVGKAKSLRSRVRSYFQPSAQHPPKTATMIGDVADVEIIVVDSDFEARILEANLIKRHRPPYNVILRDDKSFPYLKLSTKDEYPRLSFVRRPRLDGNAYFGPMIPASVARRSLKLVPKFFRVATCNEIFDGKRRPCLYYHLDQCLAPCAGKTDPEEYGRAVDDARLFLEGRHRDLEGSLERQMRVASETQEYERAAAFRDTLTTIRKLAVRQKMSSLGREDQDYLAHHRDGEQLTLQIFQIREGRVQGRREFSFDDLAIDDPALYTAALEQYYAESTPPREIYVASLPEDPRAVERWLGERRGGRVRLRVPVRGHKRRFLE
ncbi:MAG: excinuclease ABC subunit UvrC, partial [Acidobacteriota bacterium]|nr:excinuclease ABC subunit UvrC [Acidobacteriota bacterium]